MSIAKKLLEELRSGEDLRRALAEELLAVLSKDWRLRSRLLAALLKDAAEYDDEEASGDQYQVDTRYGEASRSEIFEGYLYVHPYAGDDIFVHPEKVDPRSWRELSRIHSEVWSCRGGVSLLDVLEELERFEKESKSVSQVDSYDHHVV